MSLANSTSFFGLIHESVISGKITLGGKCPFCGSELNQEHLKRMQIRIGRLRFLLNAAEQGSKTAEDLLHKIFITKAYLGGIDIPEDFPEWWDESARKIYEEIRKS